jgi:Oligosaccharyltransferase subunit Ribophorin II
LPCCVAALGFHGGLFGILALYLLFWLRLSLLQLIPLLAVAGLVTAVFGYALLSHLASRTAA